jgi:hypothetical protein
LSVEINNITIILVIKSGMTLQVYLRPGLV